MKKIVLMCLLALSINAVLIQTIVIDNSLMKNGIRVGILLLMVLCLIIKNQRLLVGLLLLIITSFIFLVAKQNAEQLSFIFLFIFVQGLFMINSKNVEKYLVVSSAISLALVFIFLWMGLTENQVLDYNDRNRTTYGTQGVPFFYNLVYGLFTLLIIYAKKHLHNIKWLIYIMSISATTYLYMMTDARGGYFSFLIFLALTIIVPLTAKLSILRIIIGLTPLYCLGIAFFIASLHDNYSANELLSLRPTLLNNFFSGLSLSDIFLSDSVKALDDTNIVDNSYLHLFIGGGIFLNLAVIYLFFKAIINMYKDKHYVEIAFLISTCLYFNMESLVIRVENMFVIYFWYLMIKHSLMHTKSKELDAAVGATKEVSNPKKKRRRFKRYRIVW